MDLHVKHVDDFEVTGEGRSSAWGMAEWQTLTRVGKGKSAYATTAKVLYSKSGIYFLFRCEDKRITCTMAHDCDDIYNEDVVEVFLWPDESRPLYFEYEISPLGVELPIVVPNQNGTFFGWRPWHYEGARLVRRATSVRGGEKLPLATIAEWTAEFFVPFELLTGVMLRAPGPGCRWRANMYRIDYDEAPESHWAWCPDTQAVFHNFRKFGTFIFA
jgi:hypothetical protein